MKAVDWVRRMLVSRPTRGAIPAVEDTAGQRGSALVLALLVLGSLSMIGTTLVLTSVAERRTSGYYRDSMKALAAAETGAAFAKRAIQDMTAPIGDMNGNGRPDFTLHEILTWGAEYEVVAEASDIAGAGIAAYRAGDYEGSKPHFAKAGELDPDLVDESRYYSGLA
ncbi:MAG: hypothetical protein GY778_05620, partial [bacterium]|nr:hypothetical protein [bacterium]